MSQPIPAPLLGNTIRPLSAGALTRRRPDGSPGRTGPSPASASTRRGPPRRSGAREGAARRPALLRRVWPRSLACPERYAGLMTMVKHKLADLDALAGCPPGNSDCASTPVGGKTHCQKRETDCDGTAFLRRVQRGPPRHVETSPGAEASRWGRAVCRCRGRRRSGGRGSRAAVAGGRGRAFRRVRGRGAASSAPTASFPQGNGPPVFRRHEHMVLTARKSGESHTVRSALFSALALSSANGAIARGWGIVFAWKGGGVRLFRMDCVAGAPPVSGAVRCRGAGGGRAPGSVECLVGSGSRGTFKCSGPPSATRGVAHSQSRVRRFFRHGDLGRWRSHGGAGKSHGRQSRS